MFSREELLGGMPSRRARTLLFAIEGQTARQAERTRKAMVKYLTERAQEERERVFLSALADARDQIAVTSQDLERYAPEWASLVPDDAETVAALAAAVGEKYDFRRQDARALTEALRLEEPDVRAAFERQQGQPVESMFVATMERREEVRWWQSRLSQRLESLPPAWTAFALTLTELLGAGAVALPIAFAAVGPSAAVVLLVIFGLVSVVTVAALVEAITRSGTMRFGATYLGRFVGEYFGRPGAVAASLAFTLFNAVGLVILILGFGTTVGDISGTPAAIWAAVLAIGVIFILRRDSLDATVASVLVVGTINVAVVLGIVVLALGSFDEANFVQSSPGEGPGVAVVIGLVFGTALVAFHGHSSASNAAKVVLARDPTGRSLLKGNVMAMLTAMVIYISLVVVTLGAVPAEELIGFEGTALTPLAAATGPAVTILGLVFVVLALGLSALHMGLGLSNQVGEWLPSAASQQGSRLQALLLDHRTRSIIKAAPVVAMLLIVEVLLLPGNASFTEAVSFLGTVTLPLLAGLFPMLLLVAARRRGEYLPGRSIGIFGHPLVAVAVSSVYMGGLLAHGLIIWDDFIPRVVAIAVAAAMGMVVAVSIRDDRFRQRLVAELRIDRSHPSLATASVVVAGRHGGVPFHWTTQDGADHEAEDGATLGDAAAITAFRLDLPTDAPSLIRTWVHVVDDEAGSSAWPAAVTIEGREPGYALDHDERGVTDFDVAPADGVTIRITPSPNGGGTRG
jgi:amino acid permease